MNYIGIKCPVCGEVFTESDDIVVCPECGAPYHRSCYSKAGHCLFKEKHGTAEAWQPPKEDSNGEAQNRCPRCGKINMPNALFCDQCGQPLTLKKEYGVYPPPYGNSQPYQNPQNPQNPQPGNFSQNGLPINFVYDPMGGVKPEEPIGNVTAGEVAKLVQNNTNYYLPVFMNLTKLHKNRFNFSAFIFSGGWLLYRKQYKIGTILTLITMTLYTISSYLTYSINGPLVMDLMQQVGVNTSTNYPTMQQYMAFSDLMLQQEPTKILLFLLPALLWAIRFGIMLYVGFNGNQMYLKHCVNKTAAIQASSSDTADRALQYQTQGGVNTSLAICLLICYMIVVYLPQLLLYY